MGSEMEKTVLATGNQMASLFKLISNTFIGLITQKDDRPPVCSVEAIRRFLQLFVEVPEFRRICERYVTMETLKECFKPIILSERLKFWQDNFGEDAGTQIMDLIGWVYDHKFELKPPVLHLLEKASEIVFWRKTEEVQMLSTKETNYFTPGENFLLDFIDGEKLPEAEKDEKYELAWRCLRDQFIMRDSHTATDLLIRIERALPQGFCSGRIYGSLRELMMRTILDGTGRYYPALELYEAGNFPLGFKKDEPKTLVVLCEG